MKSTISKWFFNWLTVMLKTSLMLSVVSNICSVSSTYISKYILCESLRSLIQIKKFDNQCYDQEQKAKFPQDIFLASIYSDVNLSGS